MIHRERTASQRARLIRIRAEAMKRSQPFRRTGKNSELPREGRNIRCCPDGDVRSVVVWRVGVFPMKYLGWLALLMIVSGLVAIIIGACCASAMGWWTR